MLKLRLAGQAEWIAWLEDHHETAPGVWLEFARQASGVTTVTHQQALEAALCYGWIDGQTRRLDDVYWTQQFVPRKADSIWSLINRQKAVELIERGLMKPAGQVAIERARVNGRWQAAYAAPSTAVVPPDLAAAFLEQPEAARFFATLNSKNRYAILFRLQTAKKPETRANRLAKFVAMLVRGETLH